MAGLNPTQSGRRYNNREIDVQPDKTNKTTSCRSSRWAPLVLGSAWWQKLLRSTASGVGCGACVVVEQRFRVLYVCPFVILLKAT